MNDTILEEKAAAYRALKTKVDELEKQKRALGAEILQLLPQDAEKISVGAYRVKRMSRLSIRTSVETARQLGAVKTEEVVDKDKIKELVLQGIAVPDVTEVVFVQVSEIASPKEEGIFVAE